MIAGPLYAHYCKSCKRIVPHVPGIDVMRGFTLGVAHVVREPGAAFTVPCLSFRRYTPDEQLTNLEEMELE